MLQEPLLHEYDLITGSVLANISRTLLAHTSIYVGGLQYAVGVNYIEVGSIWKWLELYTSLPPAWTFVSLSDGAWSQFRDQVSVVCT